MNQNTPNLIFAIGVLTILCVVAGVGLKAFFVDLAAVVMVVVALKLRSQQGRQRAPDQSARLAPQPRKDSLPSRAAIEAAIDRVLTK